jgi:hypothetical protein
MDKKSKSFFPGAGIPREVAYRKHQAEKRREAFAKRLVGLVRNFISTAAFLFVFKILGFIKITFANIFLYPLFWWVFLFVIATALAFLKARKDF